MQVDTSSARHISPGAGDPRPGFRPAQKAIFRKEGVYWTFGYEGSAVRLKDTKGLGYIAHLLRHPDAEFHVLDLYGGIASPRDEHETNQPAHDLPRADENFEKAGIHIAGLGDAGEMLDEQAKAAYRRRLSELRQELEEARELQTVERAEQAENEIDALTRELSRAVGLGGRNRRAASASERARQSITKAIKSSLETIAQSEAPLGDLLSRCIKTGNFCSYQRDPDFPIAWEFAETIRDQAEQLTSISDPVSAHAVRSQTVPVMLDVSPFSLAERTKFVGRQTERGAIRAVIDRALSGHGSVVMLGGGPGVGKSRLAMEMADYASRVGFKCLVGRCYERDEPFPYLPFVEIIESALAHAASTEDFLRRVGDNAAELAQIAPSLRRVFPDIPPAVELPPAQKRRYLFQSISETFARVARTRSYFLILEDLHWADESSLALLVHLANRVAQLPVVIIATYRDGYSDNNPVLIRTLEELIRLGIRPLKLSGLSKDSVAQMLHGLSHRDAPENLVSLIFNESQGNAFFVEELYRHLTEEGSIFDAAGQFRTDIKVDEINVPENVRLVIRRRLERLQENEKRMLAAAAVIGRSFSFQLLSEISRIDVDELFNAIEKAQAMGIVVPSSEGPDRLFSFAHELVRQTLLTEISAPRRQQLHASVADAIERLYPGALNERAGDIADHLRKAGSFGDDRRLVHYLTMAGKGALEAGAFEAARQSFSSALSNRNTVNPGERADLLASYAVAEHGLQRRDAAIANLREALEIYINLGDREMVARSFADLTDALSWAAQFDDAIKTARRGLAYLKTDPGTDRVRLLAAAGEALANTAGYEPAQEVLREAADLASRLSDPKTEFRLLAARALVNLQVFRLREAADDGFRGDQLSASEVSWQRVVLLLVLSQVLVYLGRLKEAVNIADKLEPLAKKIEHPYAVALCGWTRALSDFGGAPDLTKLETILREISKSDQTGQSPYWEFTSELNLVVVDFFRGNWTAALSHARACSQLRAGSSIEGLGVGALFQQLAYARDRNGALAIMQENRALLPVSGRHNTIGSWWILAFAVEGLVILGEHSQAGELYPLVRELLATGAVLFWPTCRFTQTIAGIASAAGHKWETAEEHFRMAMQQAESFPHVLEQAEIRRFHAMMLIDRGAPGDRERARRMLADAREIYTRIGMHRHSEITQALLD